MLVELFDTSMMLFAYEGCWQMSEDAVSFRLIGGNLSSAQALEQGCSLEQGISPRLRSNDLLKKALDIKITKSAIKRT